MNVHDYRFLLSERETLRKLISQTSLGNVIGRMSLESRLRQVEGELEAYAGYSPRVVNARLTFRGRPVIESHGINADFGTDAANAFAESVTKVGAGWHSSLPSSGPIPNAAEYQLLITGTATGSFGFQLEDAAQQPAFEGHSTPVELAIKKVKEILEATVATDEELAEAIADTDRRALDSVQAFLKKMADSEAMCALEFQRDEFSFRDVAQVRRSENRLSNDNIQESNVTLYGYFQGFLPNSRRAEVFLSAADTDFLQEAIGTVVSGKVEPTVDDTVNINEILYQEVMIEARSRRVGQGRPRFFITDWRQKP